MRTVIVLLLALASVARADSLFAVSGSAGTASTLYELDKTDGSVLATIGATGFSHVTGISFHPQTGVLYGVVNPFGGFSGQLITIDPATGAGTLVGNTNHRIPDIAFAPDGTLYGWAQIPGAFPAGQDNLIEIDLATGATTEVGPSALLTFSTGFGIDSAGTAWNKASQFGASDSLHSIDLTTGAFVPVGDPSGLGPRGLNFLTSVGPSVNNMLAFDENDVLYSGLRTGPRGSGGFNLYTIDLGVAFPGSPAATTSLVGSNSLGFISGLAFRSENAADPIPEPGSLLLVALGGGALVLVRRRRRSKPSETPDSA